MVALSQDLTPRNIYAPRARGSGDSYGFPAAHSSGSSISSGGNYPYYSASVASVESSVTDYSSTTSESYENGHLSRTLPRPSNLLSGSAPPGPQSMMSQFSSKMPSNTQKKHKCKVCDKRFTRPSSLQTHMYSHTGEKRKYFVIFLVEAFGTDFETSVCMWRWRVWKALLCCLESPSAQEGPQGWKRKRIWWRGGVESPFSTLHPKTDAFPLSVPFDGCQIIQCLGYRAERTSKPPSHQFGGLLSLVQ